jgi:hypothetical protein
MTARKKYWVIKDGPNICSWFDAKPKTAAQNLRSFERSIRERYPSAHFTLHEITKTEYEHIWATEQVMGLHIMVPGEDRHDA